MGYECRKPAVRRFYNAEAVALAGAQLKLQVTDTWACDECWETFRVLTKRKAEESNP